MLWLVGCVFGCSSALAQPVPSYVARVLYPLRDEQGAPIPSSGEPIVERQLVPSRFGVYARRWGALVQFIFARRPEPVLAGGWVSESLPDPEAPPGGVWGVSPPVHLRVPTSVLHPWLPRAEVRERDYQVAYLSNAGELLLSIGGRTYIASRDDRRWPMELPVPLDRQHLDRQRLDQILLCRDRRVVMVLPGALGVLSEGRWNTIRWPGDGTLERVCEDSRGDVYVAVAGEHGRVLHLRDGALRERFAGDFEARTMSCLRAGGVAVVERSGGAMYLLGADSAERHEITPPLPHTPEVTPARSNSVLWAWMTGGHLAAIDLLPALVPRPREAP